MFKSDFRKKYTDFLRPYGYTYCKEINYFLRVINDELISFIGYRMYPGSRLEEKVFVPVGGCVSVYFTSLDKEGFQVNECELFHFYREKEKNADYHLCQYIYNKFDNDEIRSKIEESFAYVEKYFLSVIKDVKDLDEYIDYNMRYSWNLLRCDLFAGDSLVLIKSDNRNDFMDYYRKALKQSKVLIDKGIIGKTIDEEKKDLYHAIVENIAKARDKVYEDRDLYKKAIEEADRRKKANTELLRSYGLEI